MRLRVLACLVLSCLCASESSAQQQVVESPLPPQSVRIGRGDEGTWKASRADDAVSGRAFSPFGDGK